MKNIRTIFLSAILMAGSFMAGAKDGDALPFLRIVRDPSAAAMGFSGAASSASMAYSSFRNASVIPFAEGRGDAAFSYQYWAPDGVQSSNYTLGTGFKLFGGRLGVALGGAWQRGTEYELYDDSGAGAGTYTPNDIVVNLGAGVRVMKNLSVGANVRYASQQLSSEDKFSAFATDLFVTWRLSDFNISGGLSSLGSSVVDENGNANILPSSATIAGEYNKVLGNVHGIRVDADADYFFTGDFTCAFGAQYSWKNTLFVRAGYHVGADEAVLPSFATLGLGVRIRMIRLDAAWLTGNDILGNTATVGLRVLF